MLNKGFLISTTQLLLRSKDCIKLTIFFDYYRDGKHYLLKDAVHIASSTPLYTVKLKGESDAAPEWYVPYKGQKLSGQSLLDQIQRWEETGIIEPSHAKALREAIAHPEWFDLSDRTMVLFGAASEAGPLPWLAKWKANIVAVDLPNSRVWGKILNTIQQGNATLIAPCVEAVDSSAKASELKDKLGANLLTQLPEIAQWLVQFPQKLDLAAIAYLDGEKHVRVSMAMDSIMQFVSEHKSDTSLMFMCTPTDVYAVPKEVAEAAQEKFKSRRKMQKLAVKGVSALSLNRFFSSAIPRLDYM